MILVLCHLVVSRLEDSLSPSQKLLLPTLMDNWLVVNYQPFWFLLVLSVVFQGLLDKIRCERLGL